jgi:putative transposase
MRTIKEEVELAEYWDFEEAYRDGQFLEDMYSRKRIHFSSRYLTPMELENQRGEQ